MNPNLISFSDAQDVLQTAEDALQQIRSSHPRNVVILWTTHSGDMCYSHSGIVKDKYWLLRSATPHFETEHMKVWE